jgi:predicted YcjX-like family ATPase
MGLMTLGDEARIAAASLADFISGRPLRLGVTGLSRAGKTVFITALIHNLLHGGRLPVLRAAAQGRLISARLEQQPDDAVPRFAYEDHLAALTGGHDGPQARTWPHSTRRISELRLVLSFESDKGWRKGTRNLVIDLVDYPGEWLLDLPLLQKSYAQWSRETLEASAQANRASLAAAWRGYLASLDVNAPAQDEQARKAADLFTAYLHEARQERFALSTLPPGRFLMPGDLEGSPALTFSPLPIDADIKEGSLAALMQRRYEAYKTHVIRPFFRDHFARLDRQIVLVDLLGALNSGPSAVRDLETALTDVLQAFRTGAQSPLARLIRPRIERILFAATKADHLHHTQHDRLEAILRHLVARAINRGEATGVAIDVIALAALRATQEVRLRENGAELDAISGTPLAGDALGDQIFDGTTDMVIFPGELPEDPRMVFRGEGLAQSLEESDWRFIRFRPPIITAGQMPHIRLDRALQFLIGDRLA